MRKCLFEMMVIGIIRNFMAASVHTSFTKTQAEDAGEEAEAAPEYARLARFPGRVRGLRDVVTERGRAAGREAQGCPLTLD